MDNEVRAADMIVDPGDHAPAFLPADDYVGVKFRGPLMFAFDSEVEFVDCTFGMADNDPSTSFIVLPRGRAVLGAARIMNGTRFLGCEFFNIGWLVNRQTYEQVMASITT